MIDYDTWFWSSYAHSQTTSEGPGDPENPYARRGDGGAKWDPAPPRLSLSKWHSEDYRFLRVFTAVELFELS